MVATSRGHLTRHVVRRPSVLPTRTEERKVEVGREETRVVEDTRPATHPDPPSPDLPPHPDLLPSEVETTSGSSLAS